MNILHFVFITLCHSFVGTSVIFTYIWHITLFGACMAVSGYAERQNRHALTCRVVVPKSLSSKSILMFTQLHKFNHSISKAHLVLKKR